MSESVTIRIKSTQECDGETDQMELVTCGKYYKKGGKYYISYQESEVTGMEGTSTVIKAEPETSTVNLMRFGQFRSQLIFEKNKRHNCMYDTFNGMMMVSVNAHDMKIGLNKDGGTLKLGYMIEINGSVASKNSIVINVKADN